MEARPTFSRPVRGQSDAQSGTEDGHTPPTIARGDQTHTIRLDLERETAFSQPVLMLLGHGASLVSLANPRLFAIGQTLEIGRRHSGRPDRVDELLLNDSAVSARHARVLRPPQAHESFVIEDLHSTNGTVADGARVEGRAALRNGSVLFIGSHVLIFRLLGRDELAAIEFEAANPLGPLPTLSPALALETAKLRLLAPSGAEILLAGETGVGKEVFARAIHAASGRPGRFIAVNCAAIPAELAESELYGYERGAHSTAHTRRSGYIELARSGTLFLDEIGDMNLALQSKLLRFLQDHLYTPLGSDRVFEADVRIIAATSRTVVGAGAHIQEALLGRLGAQPITLPPLRDRLEDIGRLVGHFLAQARSKTVKTVQSTEDDGFRTEALQAFFLHAWPLNVRELSKVIGEAALLSRGGVIGLEHLPASLVGRLRAPSEAGREVKHETKDDDDGKPAREGRRDVRGELAGDTRRDPGRDVPTDEAHAGEREPEDGAGTLAAGGGRETEKQRVIQALASTAGNQSRAARLLGMSRRALVLRLDRYAIPRPRPRRKPTPDD